MKIKPIGYQIFKTYDLKKVKYHVLFLNMQRYACLTKG